MTPRCYSMHWSIDRSSTSRHSDGPPEGRDGTSRALLIGLSLLFLGSSLGTGLFISTISTTERQAMQISVFLLMPAILLSGFAFSRENMPWIANKSGLFIPLTHYLVILRGIILKGVGLDVLWPETIWLTVMGVALLVFSANRFQKRIG
jgi:ABC-type polysaccharide/polyol phosphate export permease